MNKYLRQAKEKIEDWLSDDSSKSSHWSENWDKALYRIRKCSNDNGAIWYHVQRKVYGNDIWKLIDSRSCKTEEEARKAIESNKEFYRENWNREFTRKVEYIDV